MNRFFTLLLAASSLTAVGQVTYPYNPDGDADGSIAVIDLQDFLSTYGLEFTPGEVMVDSIPLSTYLMFLQEALVTQALRLDSVEIALTFLNGTPTVAEYSTCWISNNYLGPMQESFQNCCSQKLQDGWTPQGGFHKDGSNAVQAFVKYAN